MSRRRESVIKLVVTDRRAGSIAHISINRTAVIAVPRKCPLHPEPDAIAIIISPFMFNNHRPLTAR